LFSSSSKIYNSENQSGKKRSQADKMEVETEFLKNEKSDKIIFLIFLCRCNRMKMEYKRVYANVLKNMMLICFFVLIR